MAIPKTDIEKIIDKIDGEMKTAKEWNHSVASYEDRNYYWGKEKALADLKTWINENIKP